MGYFKSRVIIWIRFLQSPSSTWESAFNPLLHNNTVWDLWSTMYYLKYYGKWKKGRVRGNKNIFKVGLGPLIYNLKNIKLNNFIFSE